MSGAKHGNGDLKNCSFTKVRSKELKIFNILRAYELKFEPNLGCRAENSSIFWQIFLIMFIGVKIWYFCSKWGSKEVNHAATTDLKNGGRGVKRRSCPPYIPIPPFQVSALPRLTCLMKGKHKHTINIIFSQYSFFFSFFFFFELLVSTFVINKTCIAISVVSFTEHDT